MVSLKRLVATTLVTLTTLTTLTTALPTNTSAPSPSSPLHRRQTHYGEDRRKWWWIALFPFTDYNGPVGKTHHLDFELLRYYDATCTGLPLDVPLEFNGHHKISSDGECVRYPPLADAAMASANDAETYLGWTAEQFGPWRMAFSAEFGQCDFVLFGKGKCQETEEIGRIEYVNEMTELADTDREDWMSEAPRCWTVQGVVHGVRMECYKDGEQVKKIDKSGSPPEMSGSEY